MLGCVHYWLSLALLWEHHSFWAEFLCLQMMSAMSYLACYSSLMPGSPACQSANYYMLEFSFFPDGLLEQNLMILISLLLLWFTSCSNETPIALFDWQSNTIATHHDSIPKNLIVHWMVFNRLPRVVVRSQTLKSKYIL